MNRLLLKRYRRAVAAAALFTIAFASFPTPAWSQASITYQPPGTFAWGPSGDGSAIIGTDGSYAFIEKNSVKTILTMGGLFSFPGGWTSDASTVVGIEFDATFTPYAWIWHEGDAEPTPILPEVSVSRFTISADGSTLMGMRPIPGTFDAKGFVIRNGVFSELDYPGAITTDPFGLSADGSVISGTVYREGPTFNLLQDAIVWHQDGSATLVPLPPSLRTSGGGVSSDGSTVFGLRETRFDEFGTQAFVWKVGDAAASIVDLGSGRTFITMSTPDGSTLVGGGWISFNVDRGFVWRNGTLQILEPAAGFSSSSATTISIDGSRIVGESFGLDSTGNFRREVTIWDGDLPPQLLRDMLAAKGVTVGSPRLDLVFGTSFDGTTIVGLFFDPAAPEVQSGSFVAVLPLKSPAEMTQDLIDKVQGAGLPHGIETSLLAKLSAALDALNQDDVATAISKLTDFINQVNALSGIHIPAALADELIADAQAIIDTLNE